MVALPVPDDKKTLSILNNTVGRNGACLFCTDRLRYFG